MDIDENKTITKLKNVSSKLFFSVKNAFLFSLKNDFNKFLFISLFVLFFGLVIGQMIFLIGGKSIVKPFSVHAFQSDGKEIQHFKRFMQLARSGNYTLITSDLNKDDGWRVENVFLKKIIIGAYRKDLQKNVIIKISIGESEYVFSGREILSGWKEFSFINVQADLQDVSGDYVLFEAPEYVSLPHSKIPFYSNFFGSILNWAGDGYFFLYPPFIAILHLILICVFLFINRIIFILYINKKEDSFDDNKHKEESIVFSITILLSAVFIFLIIIAVGHFYRPDIMEILENSHLKYLEGFVKNFRPKPVERMQFMVAVLASPFVISLIYLFVNRYIRPYLNLDTKLYHQITMVSVNIAVFFLLYFGLALNGFYFVSDNILYNKHLLTYSFSFIIFPLFFYLFLLKKGQIKEVVILLKIIIGGTLLIVFLINIIILSSNFLPSSLDPVIYPVSQVVAGKQMLHNVTSFYGLYPFFIRPIFSYFPFNTFSFSVVMALLQLASFVFLLLFLRIIIKNRTIAYAGFLFIVFMTVLTTRINPDYYYQYWPIRFFFPTLALLLNAIYFKYGSKILYYLSFLVYSVAVFWNFDVGVIVFFTWFIVLLYNDISLYKNIRSFLKKFIQHTLMSLLSLIFVYSLFLISIFKTSHTFPEISLAFIYQKMFLSGYLMISLVPPPHLWSLVMLLYLTGLLFVMMAIFKKSITFNEKIIAILVSMGVGLFAYYEGQSSDVTLFRVWYPALILIVLYTDKIFTLILNKKISIYTWYMGIGLAIVVISGVGSIFINMAKYYSIINNILYPKNDNMYYQINTQFIKSFTKEKEGVLILAPLNQGILYSESNTKSLPDVPSVNDIVFPEEMDKLINFLESDTNHKIFAQLPLLQYDAYDKRIRVLLEKRYKEQKISERGLVYYTVK